MNFNSIKDPLIISIFFFVAASDWFENWLKDLFPSLRTTNPLVFTLIKTGIFAGMYWLYSMFLKGKWTDEKPSAPPTLTKSSGSG
nr:MAG: hypothetical protein DiTV3a_F8ORF2 [Diabrotica toursvirus 3a]